MINDAPNFQAVIFADATEDLIWRAGNPPGDRIIVAGLVAGLFDHDNNDMAGAWSKNVIIDTLYQPVKKIDMPMKVFSGHGLDALEQAPPPFLDEPSLLSASTILSHPMADSIGIQLCGNDPVTESPDC